MTTPIFRRKDNRLIIVTGDLRSINAIIDGSEAASYIDDVPRWIDAALEPTGLVGHVIRAIAKIGSDVVSPRELKDELIKATADRDQDLNRMSLNAINDAEGVWQPDADLYETAMDYVRALLNIGGIAETCYLYKSDELVGYRLEVAGRVIKEILFGTESGITIRS